LVSNGLQLRLLRDNVRIVRQAYLEFDLEAIFDGEHYATFAILFRMLHATRFVPQGDSTDPAHCLFEQAAAHASSTAIRAMETLRGNIEKALRELGGGFLHHAPLRQKLRDGTLSRRAYHQQLVRMLYRFLFLFIAEDRELLHPEETDPATADLYKRTYSMNRVRALAIAIKGAENHHDIYESTRLVLRLLGGTEPCPILGLVPLGSLFRADLTPDLNDAPLPNKDYLAAIRALVTTTDATHTRRTVDLSHLGAEEIGSVYERLLEIEPVITWDPPRFDTPSTAGNERKITGSYYTPDSLVQTVLDSALEPVVDKVLAEAGSVMVARENALLNLRICDPACGSGHFLVAAARRLALRLARVRALDHEPSPPEVRAALRAVVSRCIFGVDLNPMAVELCQFALWLEAMSPGKPLGFLRHHIRMGNSLMGATPDLVEAGIPDDAFDVIEGDDKKYAASMKRINKEELKEQGDLYGGNPLAMDYAEYLRRVRALDLAPDETLGQIAAKSTEFDELTNSEVTYRQTTLKYDLWCAAFVQHKVPTDHGGLTQSILKRVSNNPNDLAPQIYAEVRRLANAYHFFHWDVMFPTVFEKGGFDCVLGNPPWERVKLQEQEYFAASGRIDIAEARNASVRKKLIEALALEDPRAYATFMEARRAAEAESHFARHSQKFPLCGRGDVNTYALFAELCR
ncbi:MAG: Eco57I restriction-modification methylase domain-containing protein, partial [Gemmataceae bacterium]